MTDLRQFLPFLALALLLCAAGGARAGFLMPEASLPVDPAVVAVATTIDQMTPEMARAYVEGIQEQLALRGYDPGPADGALGPRTERAIRAYQGDVGLPVDGVASKELLEYMLFNTGGATSGPEPVASLDPVFVRSVQIELVERGYYAGEIDGIVGPATRSAVESFQADAGLVVNGAMDQRLLDELRGADPSVRAD